MRSWNLFLVIPFLFSACTAPLASVTSSESQLMVRQAQTREYDEVSKKQAMRASIATLQDLDFILDRVDDSLGMISASKYRGDKSVKMTITVREKGESAASIRANTTFGEKAVENPVVYQDFFTNLDKSLFLVKNDVN